MAKNRRQSAGHHASEHPSKKQKTAGSNGSDLTTFFNSVLKSILSLKDDGDYKISLDFATLPKKSDYPEYFDEIKKPISIHEIKTKVTSETYSSIDEFLHDFELMSKNAAQFNEEDSDIAQNALTIFKHVEDNVKDYKKSKSSTPKIKLRLAQREQSLNDKLSAITQELIDFKDNDVDIAEPFLLEVDRELYPDYYEVIKKAMALTTVENKIKDDKYTSIDDFVKDVELIWKNAQTYNQEGSLIYEDSKTLQDFFHKKVDELKNSTTSENTQQDENGNDSEAEDDAEDEQEDDKEKNTEEEELIEEPVETPVKKKLGRPKGRPPKPKVVTPVIPTETEDLLNQELGENLLESNLLGNNDESKVSLLTPPTQLKKEDQIVLLDTIDAIPSLLETFSKIKPPRPAEDALIQELTISSSRSIYRSTVKSGLNPGSVANMFQNWFEYQFEASTNQPDSYSITLDQSVQGAVSVSAGLNDSLIQTKHSAYLTVNGEKVNPTPSIHYADSGRRLTSRYELKLASGLNIVVFNILVEGQGNSSDPVSEKLTIWVQVL